MLCDIRAAAHREEELSDEKVPLPNPAFSSMGPRAACSLCGLEQHMADYTDSKAIPASPLPHLSLTGGSWLTLGFLGQLITLVSL